MIFKLLYGKDTLTNTTHAPVQYSNFSVKTDQQTDRQKFQSDISIFKINYSLYVAED